MLHKVSPRYCLHEHFSYLLPPCLRRKGFGVHCCEKLVLCSVVRL